MARAGTLHLETYDVAAVAQASLKKSRGEIHLVSGDDSHPEGLRQVLLAPFGQHLEWGLPAKLLSRVRIDVGADEVDVVLGEVVERRALGQDSPEERVGVLDVRLLPRAVRVAVVHLDALLL